jgi:hypothetical protein
MVMVNYIAGVRSALWVLSECSWQYKLLIPICGPLTSWISLYYQGRKLKRWVELKRTGQTFKRDEELKKFNDLVQETSLLEAKWESLPSLGLTTFKIGLSHRFSIIESISILSSTLTIAHGLISAYGTLRRNAGQKELGFWKDMLLSICLAVPIISTVTTSTITSIEVERDGVFVPFSDDPNQTTPGYLFLLIFGPISLFFLALIAFPFLFFTLVPRNQSTLQFASAKMSILSRTVRIATISLLFALNLCSSVYFVSRDRFPEDESIFKDCSYRCSGNDNTCTTGECRLVP